MDNDRGFHIYINEGAGTVRRMGKAALEALISASGLDVECLYFLEPHDMLEKIRECDEGVPVLIGGGDGTIRSCAAYFAKKNISFGVLPLGTMNLLARDLNIPDQIDSALGAYARGVEMFEIDAGMVNDEMFLCCSGLGTMPEASEYREQYRGDSQPILIPRLTAYVLRQMDRMNRKKLTLFLDGKKQKIKTSALVISSNQYGPQGRWTEENFLRTSLQDGILGVYSAAPYTFWDKLRLLFRLRMGDWKRDKALQEWDCTDLKIESHDETVLLSLDGETQEFDMPLEFSILPKHIKILIPKGCRL